MVNVLLLPGNTGFGLKVPVAPAGRPLIESVMGVLKPSAEEVLISVVYPFGRQAMSFRPPHIVKPAVSGC